MTPSARLTFANITSVLALVIALAGTGGAAYALGKNTVGSPQIINKSIKAKDLGRGSVKQWKIKRGAVTSGKVRNGSLSGRDLRPRVNGMAVAGATIAADGTVNSWFNRVGGKPTTSTFPDNTVFVFFPGVRDNPNAIVTVTPFGPPASCGWGDDFLTAAIVVTCSSATAFSVAVIRD